MQLYLNHVLSQANLNKMGQPDRHYEFSPLAYQQAQQQNLELPGQLSFLLEPGFCLQKLTASTHLKEQASKLLRASPDRTTIAIFLNALNSNPPLIVYDQPTQQLLDSPAQTRYCFTLSPIVKGHIIAQRDTHGHTNKPALAISHLLSRKLSDPNTTRDPIYLPSDYSPVHLTVTLPLSAYQRLVEIATTYKLQSSNARNDTGLAAAAIEALVRGLI